MITNSHKQLFWHLYWSDDGSVCEVTTVNLPLMTDCDEGEYTMDDVILLGEITKKIATEKLQIPPDVSPFETQEQLRAVHAKIIKEFKKQKSQI